MSLALEAAAPGVEGVVHDHSVFQHLVVVWVVGRQTKRQREQARRLRCEFEAVGVRAPDDQGEGIQRPILDVVDPKEAVEAARLSLMRERLGTGDVVRRRAGRYGDVQHLSGGGRTGTRLRGR